MPKQFQQWQICNPCTLSHISKLFVCLFACIFTSDGAFHHRYLKLRLINYRLVLQKRIRRWNLHYFDLDAESLRKLKLRKLKSGFSSTTPEYILLSFGKWVNPWFFAFGCVISGSLLVSVKLKVKAPMKTRKPFNKLDICNNIASIFSILCALIFTWCVEQSVSLVEEVTFDAVARNSGHLERNVCKRIFRKKISFSRIVVICGDFDERSRREPSAFRWSDESWCIFRIKVSLSLSAEINWCVCVVRVVDVRFMYFYCVIDGIVCVCLWTHLQQWLTFCGVPLLSFRECLPFRFLLIPAFFHYIDCISNVIYAYFHLNRPQ